MSSSDEDQVRPKRRRIAVDNEEEEETPSSSPTDDARAERLERRAAERRSRREPTTLFPGDDGYQATVDAQEEVVQDYIVQDEDYEEEEEDGEDLLDNMEKDYQRIEALDTYGSEGLDDRDYEAMDFDQRHAAEAELARREKGSRNQGFYGMALDNMEEEEDDEARRARRGVFVRVEQEEEEEEQDSEDDLEADDQVNLEAFDVPLREWIAQTRTRKEIQRKFRIFLRNFVEHNEEQMTRRRGNGMYEKKIRTMCASNLSSLQVSYMHLMDAEPVLAVWVVDAPKDMLDVLNEAATRHTLMLFPSYHAIHKEIHVRITSVPILDSLRDLRRVHLDCLVQVHGVVTRRSAVYPQLQIAHYQCMSCKATQGPFRVEGNGGDTYTPDSCTFCDVGSSFKLHPTLSQYRNFQRVNLQETPGSVPPGRVPRTKEVILTNDIIDIARPGEEVEVTGIYEHSYDSSLTLKSGFPVFSTFITANHVQKKEDASSSSNLTESDIAQIVELSRDAKIGEKIVASMAPSIYGHDNCKMALAMSLFSGVPKNINDKHRIRGDINVLLLGDPGTAKSQLLKYAENTAPRAVYSTGKGASAVGLTASVHKDPITKEWTLEGGALVLADRGVCLIDEFDKMNEQDRTSIHEAMEQQSISISKAGIVTSLQARCAVIAAANPIGGRYDSSNTLADNVELTDPILQRFDILCVLQDTVDPVADERMAKFITSSHMRSTPTAELRREVARHGGRSSIATLVDPNPNVIPQDLLRKYIQYARTHVHPVLRGNTFDQEKIASLYVALRKESAASGGVPIAVRHVESMMRMAEAHAKMHLREYVRDDDMDASISMMLESFLAAQKFSVRRSLRKSFNKFLRTGDDRAHLLLHMLQEMFRNEQMYQVIRMRQKGQEEEIESLEVPLDELESKARERRIYDVSEFCKSEVFQEAGYVLDERRRVISRSVE
jgi:DNA replication licensing factor MCM2